MRLSFLNMRVPIVELYVAASLYSFGSAMISLFVPIYLLSMGYALNQAFLYVFLQMLMIFLMAPISMVISRRIGIKRTTLVRIPFLISTYVLLLSLSPGQWWFFVPAILSGIAMALYFIPMHSLFAKYSSHKSKGKDVGIYMSIPIIATIIAPFIGGTIIEASGYITAIIVALIVVSLSTIPLFLTTDVKPKKRFRFRDVLRIHQKKLLVQQMVDGTTTISGTLLYPILIYFALDSTQQLGSIYTLAALIGSGAMLYQSRHSQAKHALKVAALWGILFGVSLFVRPFLSTFLGFTLVILLGAFSYQSYNAHASMALFSSYEKVGDYGDELIVYREFALGIGRFFMFAVIFLLPWKLGFIVGAAAFWLLAIYLWKAPAKASIK